MKTKELKAKIKQLPQLTRIEYKLDRNSHFNFETYILLLGYLVLSFSVVNVGLFWNMFSYVQTKFILLFGLVFYLLCWGVVVWSRKRFNKNIQKKYFGDLK